MVAAQAGRVGGVQERRFPPGKPHTHVPADGGQHRGVLMQPVTAIADMRHQAVAGGQRHAHLPRQRFGRRFAALGNIAPAVLPGVERADSLSRGVQRHHAVHLAGQADGGDGRMLPAQPPGQRQRPAGDFPGVLNPRPGVGRFEEAGAGLRDAVYGFPRRGVDHGGGNGGGADVEAEDIHGQSSFRTRMDTLYLRRGRLFILPGATTQSSCEKLPQSGLPASQLPLRGSLGGAKPRRKPPSLREVAREAGRREYSTE